MNNQTKRLFAAVPVQLDIKNHQILNRFQQTLSAESIKWIPTGHFHLTCKFFGETPVDVIEGIAGVLSEAIAGQNPFIMKINQAGIFGSRYSPRVIWLGFDNSHEIILLHQQITASLKTIGIFEDRQNFVPHVTIARIKHVTDKKYFQETMEHYRDAFGQELIVSALVLFESILTKKGPEYHIIKTFPIQNG
jgi:2'-5' RNA ligase